MKSMKRFIFAGIVILLAVSFVTCGADLPIGEVLDYTDVEYTEDGSKVTVWLDGSKPIPVTKAQRAMQGALAQMSYDFLEVIFVGSTTSTARTSWELGQPAGISGVQRNVNYSLMSGTAGVACMFVGKKDGKTLFGVGKLTHVDGVRGGNTSPATTWEITPDTKSVTFTISPIQTGLVTGVLSTVTSTTENTPGPTHPRGVIADSYRNVATDSAPGFTARNDTNSSLSSLGGVQYPTYALPTYSATPANNIVHATYTFSFVDGSTGTPGADGPYLNFTPANIVAAIKHYGSALTVSAVAGSTNSPIVQKRTPRYMENGHYMEPRNHVDTKTKVEIDTAYLTTANLFSAAANFNPVVPLTFTSVSGSNGIFSFYLQIPVYMVAADKPAVATRPNAEKWYIRTGVGSDLYSLDDGASSGGCVLMSIGSSSIDWLDIEWGWL